MAKEQIHIGDMSHETAIKVLTKLEEAMEVFDGIESTPERRNALEVGIEALRQESKQGHHIDFNELREGISRGCDYAGTQEVVHEAFLECIHDIGCEGDWDEMTAIDLNDKEIVLQDLMERFYDKVARNIVNYAKTCEASE